MLFSAFVRVLGGGRTKHVLICNTCCLSGSRCGHCCHLVDTPLTYYTHPTYTITHTSTPPSTQSKLPTIHLHVLLNTRPPFIYQFISSSISLNIRHPRTTARKYYHHGSQRHMQISCASKSVIFCMKTRTFSYRIEYNMSWPTQRA